MFHTELKQLMDDYVHFVYTLTKRFPKSELYGCTSQLRRSSLSVILNYIEGYGRRRNAVLKNFLEISYASLQESKYLLEFSKKESFINDQEFQQANAMAERIGAMLWGVLNKL